MTKEICINLPVADINKSKEFFAKLGFSVSRPPNTKDEMIKIVIGENKVIIMLFPEAMFKKFTGNDLAETTKNTEVVFYISAERKEEVDE